jgi:hypothetical protein
MANPPRVYVAEDDAASRPSESLTLRAVLRDYLSVISATINRGDASQENVPSNSQEIPGGPQCEVCRVFIPLLCETSLSFGARSNISQSPDSEQMLLVRFLLSVKQLIRDKRCSVFVTVRPSMILPSVCRCLLDVADSVFGVESFAGRSEEIAPEFKVCVSMARKLIVYS